MLKPGQLAALLLLLLLWPAQSAQALEDLGIDECIQKHPSIKNTLLSAFKDPKPKGNRPAAYYQIGAIITHPNQEKAHVPYLIVQFPSGECQAIRIDPHLGYEPLLPWDTAVLMEINHIQWEDKNVVDVPPKEEWVDVDPAEFGHGCEPVPRARAEARRRLKQEFACPVATQRQSLIWDQPSTP